MARNRIITQSAPRWPGLPVVLHALGYEVAAIGKVAHNSWASFYKSDYVAGSNPVATDSAELKKFLANRDSSKPLCLFFGTHYPHTPWVENVGYDPAKLQLPPTLVDTQITREQRAKYASSVTAADTLLGEVRAFTFKQLPGDTLFISTAD